MTVESILSDPKLEQMLQKLEKFQKRTDEDNTRDVAIIREWLDKQAHLPKDQIDDHLLVKLLRYNKFSLEKMKSKIDTFYTVRTLVPEFFENRDLLSPRMQTHMDNTIFVPLPKVTEDLSRITLFGYTSTDPDKFDIDEHAVFVFATLDFRMYHDEAVKDIILLDLKNNTLAHALKHTPALLKKAVSVITGAYSERITGIHFINMPQSATMLINITKSVLTSKLASRIHVHKDLESLHKMIPKSILPPEYGGTDKPLAEIRTEWRKTLEKHNDWLKIMSKIRSNEELRVGTPLYADIFGSMHGSFRTLNVD